MSDRTGQDGSERWPARRRNALALIAVGGVLLRLVHLLAPNGAIGFDLDASVYYGATGLMVTGYRPYADFALLHPPGILLILAPTAWLGEHLMGHAGAFVLASALSALAAGGTIVGIGTLASRWRGSTAGIVAALLYATFLPAVVAEGDILLEPFVNVLFVATALIWLSPTPRPSSRRGTRGRRFGRTLGAGALIAFTSLVKLTGAVVGIGCLVSGPFRRRWVDRAILCAAIGGVVLLTIAPFAAEAGAGRFFDQVVLTQIGRPRGGGDPGDLGDPAQRLLSMLGVGPLGLLAVAGPTGPGSVLALPLLAIALGVSWWAWSRGGVHGRFWSATWISSAVLLLAAPSYYSHYALPLMVSTAVLLAAATPTILGVLDRRRGRAAAASFVAVVVLVAPTLAVVLVGEVVNYPRADPGAAIRAFVPGDSCVYADPPSLNIAAGRLPPAGTDRPLVDPFGEPLSIALRVSRSYPSMQDAQWSAAAQDRVRRALVACPYVAFVGPVERKRYFSPATRAWFAEHFAAVVEPTVGGVGLWRRR